MTSHSKEPSNQNLESVDLEDLYLEVPLMSQFKKDVYE